MKTLILITLALAITACGETDGQRAWNACQRVVDYAAWSNCFDRHMPALPSQADSDADATILLEGATAFMNGLSQRPQAPLFTTCTRVGCITQ